MAAIGGGVSVAKAQHPWTVVVGPGTSSPSTNRVIHHLSSKDQPANPTGSHQLLGDMGHLESCFGPFGDCVSVVAR
jgi:hypothetical protein